MNLKYLIRRIEKKTEMKFSGDLPYCKHRPPIIIYPNGESEGGDAGKCRMPSCNKPQLRILVNYPNCERERKRMLIEARHFFNEMRFSDDIVLDFEKLVEIVCEEFDVSREDLLVDQLMSNEPEKQITGQI